MQKDKSKKYYEILKSAGAVFASLGFHKATISRIATEADIADGTIYLYFKNKNDILYQFISFKTEAVFQKMHDAVAEADNAEDKLRNLIKCHL
ncbi:MAG: helix-turn-helix transcriptional regulator, partial [Desulfobacteraceae bacterium]|nr:helix-turn-helix transcriptional regulator [Desulfobacteraceae bacterium]